MRDLNLYQAALRAGYTKSTALSDVYIHFKKPEVQKRIEQLMKQRSERVKVDNDWVLERLKNLVEADFTQFVNMDLDELPDDLKRMVVGVKVTTNGVEYKFMDKDKALESIARHIDFFNKDNASQAPKKLEIEIVRNSAE